MIRTGAGEMTTEEWTTDQVLAWLAEQGRTITPATWYSYVSRGQAPAPVRHIGRTPVWSPEAVRQFQATATRDSSRRARKGDTRQ